MLKFNINIIILVCFSLISNARSRIETTAICNDKYYAQAYNEIIGMLEGTMPLNLKRAVFLVEWAYSDGKPEYEKYCDQIDSTATAITSFIKLNNLDKNPIGGNIALFEYFTEPSPMNSFQPFIYDFDDYRGEKDLTKLFVTKLMETHTGQCRSMPLYYKILANEIGAKAYISYAPNHSFIRHRDESDSRWMNVELTNNSMPREVFIIESMGITERAIETGIYMRPNGDREIIISLLTDMTDGYIRKTGSIDDIVWRSLNKALNYDPDNLFALMKLSNCLFTIGDVYRKRIAENKGTEDYAMMQKIIVQLMDINHKIEDLGYVDMPQYLYDDWQKTVEQEKSRRASLKKEEQI